MKDKKKESKGYAEGGKLGHPANKVKAYKQGGETTIARGSGAARPQKFGKNG
tara:strand:- start:738 stop:893 length:156 start_codon:yes stop_codon:yes gene_type:complete